MKIIEEYADGVPSNPTLAPRYNEAVRARKQERPKEAQEVLREALETSLDPAEHAALLITLGNALYEAGQVPRASDTYSAALQAAEAIRSESERAAALSRTLKDRGSTYGSLGRYDEALADYNRSLELRPDHPGTCYNLACCYSLAGRPDEAIACLHTAITGDREYRKMAATDKEFDSIRGDSRFTELVG